MMVSIGQTARIRPGEEIPSMLARDLRRADAFISLAVQAGFAVWGEGAAAAPSRSGRYGLVLGTAYGPMQTNFDVLDQVVFGQQTSPTLFSHSVFNAAAGYLSRIFGLRGGTLTVTDFAFPFFQALQQGALAIADGRLDGCLVVQVETYSALLADARCGILGSDTPSWQTGAVAWLLTQHGGAHTIAALDVELRPAAGHPYLAVAEQMEANGRRLSLSDPLAAALATTALLAEHQGDTLHLRLLAPYGRIDLNCQPSSPE